jgi:hypothetical protein
MKKASTRTILIIAIGLLGLLLLIGCSSTKNPVAVPASQTTTPGQDESGPAESPYPPITAEQLETLIPGYQILTLDTKAMGRSENLDDRTARRIFRTVGGTVSHRNCGVQIGAWQLWEDQTVTVSTPVPGTAVVDFYPHPYQFNGCVRIWIDLTYIVLPEGMRWDQLQFFYLNDAGQYIQYWGSIDLVNRQFSVWPDHFSRYIIAAPAR